MRILFLFVCLYSSTLFGQNYYTTQKTNFNKFVEKPNIEWAMYRNDTLQTDKPDLRDMLLTKMREKKIKIFAFEISGNISENNLGIKKANYTTDDLDHAQLIPMFDSLGQEIPSHIQVPTDPGPSGIVSLHQILYVENGQIKSYISRVSPLKNINTSSGNFLGRTEYFSTALNTNPTSNKSKKDKIIFLKTTTTAIAIDSIDKNNRLKETFGHNLIETIWPYIVSNKISLFTAASNQPTTILKINNNNQLNLETVVVPVYDSLGNLFGTKLISEEITANSFDKIALIQQWYYNDTKNIVYCIIPEAYLFLKTTRKEIPAEDLKPALKITF